MDEVVDPDNDMPVEDRETEWNFREVALSVCDDYMPGQSQWGLPDDRLIAEDYRKPRSLSSGSNNVEHTVHEFED